jgi:hypothetical protein
MAVLALTDYRVQRGEVSGACSAVMEGLAMRRVLIASLLAIGLAAMPAAASAEQKRGCPGAGSGWSLANVWTEAAAFYPHLLPGHPFASAADFAAFVASVEDTNGDDWVCVKYGWGEDSNPNSHWYRLGLELLGEPTLAMMVHDNNANGG